MLAVGHVVHNLPPPHFAAPLASLYIPATVFGPYLAGALILAVGLPFIILTELPRARGLDKILPFGRLFYAIPLAVFAGDHFVFSKGVAQIVPSWIPGHMFWVFFVGVALVAASLSIVLNRHVRLAATLLGIMLFLFVVLIHLPNILANPASRFPWIIALRDLSFSGGAFALAGAHTDAPSSSFFITLARFFIAIPVLVFSVFHFLHPRYVPGVPLDRLTPGYVPARIFWAYLAGAVLFLAGSCILINRKARLAAIYLGIMVLFLVLFVYLPMNLAAASDIGNGLNYFADTLLFSGAAFVLAEALPQEGHSHV
ncbi:MAG TPA: hypothetical protein VMJ93_10590 [Verrucomicrobiae bacterium]|nr:hypothetical protein [Verrucomicrobiae bacterium]